LAQKVSGWKVCLKPQNVRASLAAVAAGDGTESTLVKFDREFRSDADTNDVYLWGEQPAFGRVRFSIDSEILVDCLGVKNPVHREGNLARCEANRERIERACRRAFSRRLANRVSLTATDFA
jgi:hypothetical protein